MMMLDWFDSQMKICFYAEYFLLNQEQIAAIQYDVFRNVWKVSYGSPLILPVRDYLLFQYAKDIGKGNLGLYANTLLAAKNWQDDVEFSQLEPI